jgi:DNA-binding LytR/AlgR family response regulator
MSSPAIALPGRSSLLWISRARGLFTGVGYALTLTLILIAARTLLAYLYDGNSLVDPTAFRRALTHFRELACPGMFWQIHRSVVVNVGAIDTIYRTFRGALEVKLKERSELLPVSAAHAHLFKDSARR